jgi:hypothetical protein
MADLRVVQGGLMKLRLLFTFIVWAITGDRAMNQRAHQLTVG